MTYFVDSEREIPNEPIDVIMDDAKPDENSETDILTRDMVNS